MRPHHPSRKRRDAGAKNHPPPSRLLHSRDTKLRQQVRRAAISAPGLLEGLDRDVGDVFHAMLAGSQTCIVEQDGWRAHLLEDILMQLPDAVVVAEIRLEAFCFDIVVGA